MHVCGFLRCRYAWYVGLTAGQESCLKAAVVALSIEVFASTVGPAISQVISELIQKSWTWISGLKSPCGSRKAAAWNVCSAMLTRVDPTGKCGGKGDYVQEAQLRCKGSNTYNTFTFLNSMIILIFKCDLLCSFWGSAALSVLALGPVISR